MSQKEELYDIFISYRRDGGEDLAVLLEERLNRLGYKVFLDVESLRSGNFNEHLLTAIENCTDFLLVLPVNGLDRCINKDDWVRKEISHALKCEKNIIPIMKRNFKFPDILPEEIENVRNKNGINASMDDFNSVIVRLTSKFLHSKPNLIDSDRDYELKKRYERGDHSVLNELALCYEFGSTNIMADFKKAFELYNESITKEISPSIYNLADIYEKCSSNFSLIKAYDIKIDPTLIKQKEISEFLINKAYEYYKKAADLNYAPALYKLGNLAEKEKNGEEAYNYYIKAAEQNFPCAENAIGFFYKNGIYVKQDLEKAEYWFLKAAKSNYAPAIYNYAILIQPNDPKRALDLLRHISFGDNAIPYAVYALGKLYESLDDISNAVDCYESSYENGIESAEIDLERCRYYLN